MIFLLKNFNLALKIVILFISLSLGVIFLFAGAHAALAANLRSDIVVEENVFTLGDIFEGLSSEKAARILGASPLPGNNVILDAPMLYRIAVALDLSWRPQSRVEQAVIRRAATLVDTNMIEDALEQQLRIQGVSGRFNIVFTGNNPKIILPHDYSASVEISDLHFDPQRGRFEATLKAPSIENPVEQLLITGAVERLVSVPILKKPLRAGELIGAYDIEWIDVRSRDVQHDIILDADKLVGLTPRRMVKAGKPIRAVDLQAPKLVSRSDSVTIVLQNGALSLTAQGRALQDGAKGDLIRVVNVSSNQSLDAIVSGSGEVTVQP